MPGWDDAMQSPESAKPSSGWDAAMGEEKSTPEPEQAPDVTALGAVRQGAVHGLASLVDLPVHAMEAIAGQESPIDVPRFDLWAKRGLAAIGEPYQEPRGVLPTAIQYGTSGAVQALPMLATGGAATPTLIGGAASGITDRAAQALGLKGWKRMAVDLLGGGIAGSLTGGGISAVKNVTGRTLEEAAEPLANVPGESGELLSSVRKAHDVMDQGVNDAYSAIDPKVAAAATTSTKPIKDALASIRSQAGPELENNIPAHEAGIIDSLGDTQSVARLQALRTSLGNTGRIANRQGNSQTANITSDLKKSVDDALASSNNPQVAAQLQDAIAKAAQFHKTFGVGTTGKALLDQGSDYAALSRAINAKPDGLDKLLAVMPGDSRQNFARAFVDKAMGGLKPENPSANFTAAQKFLATHESAGRKLLGDQQFDAVSGAIDRMKTLKGIGKPPGLVGAGISAFVGGHAGEVVGHPFLGTAAGLAARYGPYAFRVTSPGLGQGARQGTLGALFPAVQNPLFGDQQ